MEQRLPTGLWVEAHLRQCSCQNIPAYVIAKGAYAGGLVILKINSLNKSVQVLTQQRNLDGALGWMDVFDGRNIDEKTADSYIERSLQRDPDLWVIEIESRDGTNPFEGDLI